ncbi:TPA: phage protein GemA/Gp16 family protein, partial [Neisseria meningitidis]
KRSCADMDVSELESVVADMRSHGFKPKAKGNPHGKPHLRRTSSAAMLDKVEALLTVGGKHWNYAHAMARRMFGKDKVEYLDDAQLHKLVAALQIAENRKRGK